MCNQNFISALWGVTNLCGGYFVWVFVGWLVGFLFVWFCWWWRCVGLFFNICNISTAFSCLFFLPSRRTSWLISSSCSARGARPSANNSLESNIKQGQIFSVGELKSTSLWKGVEKSTLLRKKSFFALCLLWYKSVYSRYQQEIEGMERLSSISELPMVNFLFPCLYPVKCLNPTNPHYFH